MSAYLVFISHSSADTWVANQISQNCLTAGAETFIDDTEIKVGDDFETQILTALGGASELLVLLTPWARESKYVVSEIGAAWYRGIRITVVLYRISMKEFLEDTQIPNFWKKINVIDINDVERYFGQLKSRVESGQSTVESQ